MSSPSGIANNSLEDLSPEVRLGLMSALGAYVIWGGLPLYLRLLSDVNLLELVGHRIVWAVPFCALIILWRRQWPETVKAFKSKKAMITLSASAAVITVNWLTYIWAVSNERILEASLGYYINPLMFIAGGVLILREKLTRAQWIGLGLAAAGVLALTIGSGSLPWVALALAIAFTAYGFIRKQVDVGAVPGMFIETAMLAPFALGLMYWISRSGDASFGAGDGGLDLLLILGGPITVIPLTLFAIGARKLRMSTIGFLQYLAPTAQFLLGLYFGETFTVAHAVCFGLIWTGLAITTFDAFRRQRKTTPVSAGPSRAAMKPADA
ncbi:MAG: EamA family transporter RarD [Pseudomonadota bacterium]